MRKTPDTETQRAMGARLQAIREVLGLTQDQMADMAGVGVTTISGWEVGRNQIDLVKLSVLAGKLKFTTDWVALGDLSGLRFDVALKLQARTRAAVGVAPAKRGRKAKSQSATDAAPTVRDGDDNIPLPPSQAVHEAPQPPILPSKHT